MDQTTNCWKHASATLMTLAFLACGAPAELASNDLLAIESYHPAALAEVEPEIETPVEPELQAINFAPAPDIADYVAWSADRWADATGREIGIAADGVPIISQPEIWTDWTEVRSEFQDGFEPLCGLAVYNGQHWTLYIATESGCDLTVSTSHEIGHVLGPFGHAPGGALAETGNPASTFWINETTLDWVCSKLYCPDPQAEVEKVF